MPWFLQSRLRLFSTLFVTLAIPMALLMYASLGYFERTLQERAVYHSIAAARLASQTVQELFTGLSRDVESLATRPEFVRNIEFVRAPEVAETQLRALITNSHHFDRVFVTDAAGQEIFAYPLDWDAVGKSFAFRDWYTGVSAGKGTYVSEVYTRQGKPQVDVVAVATPILNAQQQPVGYLVGQCPITTLGSWLSQIKPSPVGSVALVDQHGKLAIAEKTAGTIAPELLAKGEGTARLPDPITGQDSFISHYPVTLIGWTILARQPSAAVLAPVVMLQRIIIVLAALGFAIMFSFGLVWLHAIHRHHETVVERNRQLEEDLEMAREVQSAIIPARFPSFPSGVTPEQSALRFYHRCQTAEEVGGDFFDVLALSDTEAGVFICDVIDNGLRAAMVEAMVRAFVEELKPIADDPGRLLSEVNRRIIAALGHNGHQVLASAFYLVADTATGRVRFANAGHPSALRLRREGGLVEKLQVDQGASGPALGLMRDTVYETVESEVAAKDLLLLYSDGVYEVTDPQGDRFGQQRLIEAVQRRADVPPEKLFDDLLKEVRGFTQDAELGDDICLVGIAVERVGQRAA